MRVLIYPPRSERTITNADAVTEFNRREGEAHTVVGRVVFKRDIGKLVFLKIRDGSGEIQLFIQQRSLDAARFTLVTDLMDLGDFVQASGR
jgi:lysyl-tRNA synthetase class 2